ncbi:thymidylate synthase [Cytobacillus kochii]|uniref:thymidylate synthase n=1 Tax=Cytobacillus kochii TaxID=859143 RepID=UPI001CD339BE|nr:thymidylate synthase [Cytobacillus kochii]MCA1027068.1 thymidylate synthase [Cytobacillus kochii]
MSKADLIIKNNIEKLLTNGVSEKGQLVRPKWKDGTPSYTKKVFGVLNEYDLSEEFPVVTLRPTAWKTGLKELMWIYQDKSNDVRMLEEKYGVMYWSEWENEEGNLGKAYGRQLQYEHKYKEGYFNQIDRLIWDLKKNPFSRRMITNLYNHSDLYDMTLYPCAFMTMWDSDGKSLNMSLIQRSSDFTLAGSINVTQYALLQHMIAQVTGLKVGRLHHYINNLHIYDRHIGQATELIQREPLTAPTLLIDDSVKNFYDFKPEHFTLENYNKHSQMKFEIAI